MQLGRTLSDLFGRFRRCSIGGIAQVFAISAIPLVIGIGGVVDFSMYNTAKGKLQDALDAATLNAAGSASHDATVLQSLTTTAFNANFQGASSMTGSVSAFNYNSTTKTLTASAHGVFTPTFATLFGYSSLDMTVSSTTTQQANGTLEVALVLDNTWSMSVALDATGTKIDVLKTAAKTLVDQVMTPDAGDNVKVAVVPYADYVNVGTGNRSQGWLNVAADYSVTVPQTWVPKTCNTYTTKWVCTGGHPGTCSSTTDGVVSTWTCTVGQTCGNQTVAPYQSCSGGYYSGGNTNYYKWYGCVLNQVQADGSLALPDPTQPYKGTLDTSQKCLNPIVPLTSDKSVITTAINGLVINIGGYKPETYIPAGLVWGVNAITPSAPFTEGAAFDPKNKQPRKAIVLMTDGSNTEYLKSDGTLGVANAAQIVKAYKDQDAVCAYAKDKKIEIYTIDRHHLAGASAELRDGRRALFRRQEFSGSDPGVQDDRRRALERPYRELIRRSAVAVLKPLRVADRVAQP